MKLNKRQKSLIWNLVAVTAVTFGFVILLMNLKDSVNKSEAISSMKALSSILLEYRKQTGALPPESYVDDIVKQIGAVRIGKLNYRARWIKWHAPRDSIVVYSEKIYKSIVRSGYVVMFLDGRVEFMSSRDFEPILARQQSEAELEYIQKQLKMIK